MNELLLQKYDDHYLKLKLIFERTLELIDTFNPDEIAIEAPFFGKNVQSMLKLGRAQGVAMAAGLSREIPITEYLPKKIKMAITGNGNASKEQVALMLKSLLNLKTLPKNLDATDGLAAAVCHYLQKSHDGKKARRLKKTIARSHPLHPPLFVAPHFVQYLCHRILPPVHTINFIDRNIRCVPPLHQLFNSIPKHLPTRERKLIRSPFGMGECLCRLPITQSLLPLPPQHPQIPRAF